MVQLISNRVSSALSSHGRGGQGTKGRREREEVDVVQGGGVHHSPVSEREVALLHVRQSSTRERDVQWAGTPVMSIEGEWAGLPHP